MNDYVSDLFFILDAVFMLHITLTKKNKIGLSMISDSHGEVYEDGYLLECCSI
jgi:hypothetical protein